MNTKNDPVVIAAVLLIDMAETIIRGLIIPLLALLLVIAGHGATPRRPAPALHPLALVISDAEAELARCSVADLRRRARAAGLPRSLSHRGRRDALLLALAGSEVAMI